jgi:hypothetical protein
MERRERSEGLADWSDSKEELPIRWADWLGRIQVEVRPDMAHDPSVYYSGLKSIIIMTLLAVSNKTVRE